jgi:hypothetical protein
MHLLGVIIKQRSRLPGVCKTPPTTPTIYGACDMDGIQQSSDFENWVCNVYTERIASQLLAAGTAMQVQKWRENGGSNTGSAPCPHANFFIVSFQIPF